MLTLKRTDIDRWIRPVHAHLSRLLTEQLTHWRKRSAALSESDMTAFAGMLLCDAVREGASDIHLEPDTEGTRVRLRVDGVLRDATLLPREEGIRLIRHFKTVADLDPIPSFRPQDARWSADVDGQKIDLRLAVVPCIHGEKLTLRILDPRRIKRRLGDLGLSDEAENSIRSWLNPMSGMFLVCGPTGSGKTTTLYALLHELKLAEKSVITIEDPVEYAIEGITQVQVNPRRGLGFTEGLKASLRLDPDYLLLGEIRGPEAARVALEAAISGRGLMSTLHARDCVSVVTALRNWGLANHELAASLEVVVSQRLVRRLCPHCREQRATTDAHRTWLESLAVQAPGESSYPQGCTECNELGYRDRVGVFETWRLDETDVDLIVGGADEHTIRDKLAKRSHALLLQDALAKVESGTTSLDEVSKLPGLAVQMRLTQ